MRGILRAARITSLFACTKLPRFRQSENTAYGRASRTEQSTVPQRSLDETWTSLPPLVTQEIEYKSWFVFADFPSRPSKQFLDEVLWINWSAHRTMSTVTTDLSTQWTHQCRPSIIVLSCPWTHVRNLMTKWKSSDLTQTPPDTNANALTRTPTLHYYFFFWS